MTTETNMTDNALTETKFKTLFIRALEIVEDEFGTDMPVSSVLIMLKLSMTSPTPMNQVANQSKLSGAGVSRTISTYAGYAKVNRRTIDKPYFLLSEDAVDRRYKFVSFTDYGKRIVNRILGVIYQE